MSQFIVYNHLKLQNKLINNLKLRGHFREMCSVGLSKTSSIFKNPYLDLQEYLEVPILKNSVSCWDTTVDSMNIALDLFVPKKYHKITKIANTVNPKEFPAHDLPEIAILGRSNSGKSSLLKAIFHSVPELRIQTSKKPGHTKSLKFYEVGNHLCLVDMPGYGFRQPKWFQTSVMYYLKHRKNLLRTFLLIDSKSGFHDWDDASMQMLEDLKIPFTVVLTKIDAVKSSERLKAFLHVRNTINQFQLNTCLPQIFLLSSHTFEGLPFFLAYIAHITGNLNFKKS